MKRSILIFLLAALIGTWGACAGDDPAPTPDATDIVGTDTVQADSVEPVDTTPTLQGCDTPIPEIGDGVCALQQGSADLLLQGNVMLPHGIQTNAAVLISDGLITCVGCDCLDLPAAAAATRLVCPQGVISPGLINAHDHIGWTHVAPVAHGAERYDHRHEWRKGKNGKTKLSVGSSGGTNQKIWGELRQILSGTTSFFASGGTAGFARNLDQKSNLEGISHGTADYSTFPLGDNGGAMHNSGCGDYDYDNPESAAAQSAYVPHVAEGINLAAQNEFTCVSGQGDGGVDYVRPNASFIHGIGLSTADIGLLAADGTALVWSPRSNISLYGMTANAPLYDRLGALIALGSDWVPSGSLNILRELACADYFNANFWHGHFSDADLVGMVTKNAATALGFGDVLGSLVVGNVADISIWDARTNTGYRAILDAQPDDVTLVLRGGEALYGDAALMGALAAFDTCEVLDVCGTQKRICVQSEGGISLVSLTSAVGNAYPLYFCGLPEGEPSCHPARQGEFDGAVTTEDSDGDGIVDSIDNCPLMFNPTRPMDGSTQNDADGDGDGDECDVCPFDPDTTACSSVDPEDVDGDGIKIPFDNCPAVANPDQADGDTDGTGDLCDACPTFSNPGGSACPGSIYSIKKGETPEGNFVAILDAIVTAVGEKSLFIQVDPGSDDYQGVGYSAVYVYYPNGASVDVGDRVRVEGKVSSFYGQLQLSGELVEIVEAGAVVPVPTDVDPEDIAEGGSLADPYEACLVRVTNVSVLNTQPTGGDGETVENEFLVTGELTVDDSLYLIDPQPKVGQVLPEITGVLVHSWSRKKLLPRGPGDLDLGPPSLVSLDAGTAKVYAGQTLPVIIAQLSHGSSTPMNLKVVSLDDTVLTAGNVVIDAGQTEIQVPVTGVSAGTATVQITMDDVTLETDITVLSADYQPSVVGLDPLQAVVTLGGSISLTVSIDDPAPPGGLVIGLTSEGVAANLPVNVTVPEGDTEASFVVNQFVSTGFVTIVAASGGSSKSATLDVQDAVLYGMLIVEVLYDSKGSDDKKEWVKIYNGTGSEVDLSQYGIGYGGGDYTYGVYQPLGSLPAGMCALLGGPVADPDNGEPEYDLPKDFEPDLQNSGSVADGIAIFDVPADAITSSTLPVDALIYGGSNDSGLLGPDGQTAPVNVGDATGGQSLRRISFHQWEINDAPNSINCIIIK